MKKTFYMFRLLLALLLFFKAGNGLAQCSFSVNFTSVPGPNGYVSFNGFATPTNSASTTYTWNFGNGNSAIGFNLMSTSTTYTANGTYLVTFAVTNYSPFCTQTYTQMVVVNNVCSMQINYTPPNPPNACNGSATVTSVSGMCPGPLSYSWSNGSNSAITGSLCQGASYYVNVGATSGTTCCSFLMDSVSIPTNTCNINASLIYSINSNVVSFTSTSTGTTAATTYTWSFGDGSPQLPTGTTITASHTYSNSGVYNAILYASNNPSLTCYDSVVVSYSVTMPCSITPSYVVNTNSLGVALFTSTSTGTTGATSYTWTFGDSSPPLSTNTVASTSHTYLASGIYITSLFMQTVVNTCTASLTKTVSITVPCQLNAALAHTVSSGGLVYYKSISTGTTAATTYSWDYGDGVYGTGNAPNHTYAAAGNYYVWLYAFNGVQCRDSLQQSVNVTGLPCTANANFALLPTNTPQYWTATPAYPWNVQSAVWDWGDGSTSNGLYTSHVYSVAGTYNICLSTTVSCGATASVCSQHAIYKAQQSSQDQSMIYVNVQKPALSTGIATAQAETVFYSIYPNPNNGSFNVEVEGLSASSAKINVYNLMGEQVYTENYNAISGQLSTHIDGSEWPAGVYFIKINSGGHAYTRKLVVSRQ